MSVPPVQGRPVLLFGFALKAGVPLDGQFISFDAAAKLWQIVAGGTGEVNTSSNVGTGAGLALTKVIFDLPFKSLLGTAGKIVATALANEVQFDVGADIVDKTIANIYTAGAKQTFASDVTTAGLNLAGLAGDPSVLVNGDIWHNTTSNLLFSRLNGVTREFLFRTLAQIVTNKTMDANVNTFTNFGSSEIILDLITGQTLKGVPVAADEILINSIADGAFRRVTIGSLPGGGTGTLAIVREAGADISTNRLALNFTNGDDFTITDDAPGDEAEIAINRNAANGIAGLDAGSRLAKVNQHASTVYTDQANVFGDFIQTFKDNSITIESPDGLTPVTLANLQQTLARTLSIPILTGNRNFLVSGEAQIVNADISATAAILLSKLQNIATDRILGRETAGAGSIEELTLNATLELIAGSIRRAALTGDVTSAAGSNALAYALDSIVNEDINSAAAIALSKLAALTANRALESNGTGEIIASAVINTELNLLAGQVATLVNTATASTYTAGVKQSFTHDVTNAGFRLVGAAGDPSVLVNGDIWHNTTSNLLFARLNVVTREFLFRTLAQIVTSKTIDANSNTITNIGASEVIADIITGQTAITLPVQPALDEILIHDSSAGALRRVLIEDIQKKLPSVLTAAGAIIGTSSNPTKVNVTGTNHVFAVLDFPNGSTTEAFWDFRMPSDIGTNLDLTFIITWISTITSGDVDFEAAILGRADSEPYDAALTNATIVTLVTDGVAGDINRTTITINTSGVDEDDDIIVRIRRLGGADTMVADARFINCRMEYA